MDPTLLLADLFDALDVYELVALLHWRFGAGVAGLVAEVPPAERRGRAREVLTDRGLINAALFAALAEHLPGRAGEIYAVMPAVMPAARPALAPQSPDALLPDLDRVPRGVEQIGALPRLDRPVLRSPDRPERPVAPDLAPPGSAAPWLGAAELDRVVTALVTAGACDEATLRGLDAAAGLSAPPTEVLPPEDRAWVRLSALNVDPAVGEEEPALFRWLSVAAAQHPLPDLEAARLRVLALAAAERAVVILSSAQTFANGVLVAPSLVLTSDFVKDKAFLSGGLTAEFPATGERLSVLPEELPGDKKLGWGLVRLAQKASVAPVALAPGAPSPGSAREQAFRLVWWSGSDQKTRRRHSQPGLALVAVEADTIRYLVESANGSAGGPLIDAEGRVFAVHHGAQGGEKGPLSRYRFGAAITQVRTQLAATQPALLDEIEPRGVGLPTMDEVVCHDLHAALHALNGWSRVDLGTLSAEERRFVQDGSWEQFWSSARSGRAGRDALLRFTDAAIVAVSAGSVSANPVDPTQLAALLEARAKLDAGRVTQGHARAPVARLESLLGSDNLLPVGFLDDGLRAGGAVVALRVPRVDGGELRGGGALGAGFGSGFLITPSLVMTNHHVIVCRLPSEPAPLDEDLAEQARRTEVRFGFDAEGAPGETVGATKLERTNPSLDVAILRLLTPVERSPVRLNPRRVDLSVVPRRWVNIIQHPLQLPKQVVIRDNLLFSARYEAGREELAYFADTERGSSGSPVFDDGWRVIGVHRGTADADKTRRETVNFGVPLVSVLDWLANDAPELFAEIVLSHPELGPG